MATDATKAPHPLAGKLVILKDTPATREIGPYPVEYRIEGRWVDVSDRSWQMACNLRNPAALGYLNRSTKHHLPGEPEHTLYGKVSGFGHIVHASEIEREVTHGE